MEVPEIAIVAPEIAAPAPEVEAPPAEVLAPETSAPAAEAPVVEVVAPEIAVPAPEVEAPEVEVILPEIALPETEAVVPEAESARPEAVPAAVQVEVPTVEAGARQEAPAAVEIETPGAETVMPPITAPATEIETPQSQAVLLDIKRAVAEIKASLAELALLRTEITALSARIAELETFRANAIQDTYRTAAAPVRPVAGTAQGVQAVLDAEGGPKLPGSDDVARIAAEMAALKAVSRPRQVTEAGGMRDTAPAAQAPVLSTRLDNLILIDGVGPAYVRRLQRAGFTTYRAVFEASDEHLAQVTGATVERVRREQWREQARLFGNLR